jgi:hypothetical protein
MIQLQFSLQQLKGQYEILFYWNTILPAGILTLCDGKYT